MNRTKTYKRIWYTIIVAALLMAVFTLGKAVLYSPSEEPGLSANISEVIQSIVTATSSVISRPQTTEPTDTTSTDDKPALAVNPSSNSPTPATLSIPKIGVNAKVQQVGIRKDGAMGVPTNYTDVGWYKLGTLPGNKGSAVISGHQDNGLGRPAVFYKLDQLKVGDDIYVTRADGKKLHFKVVETRVYPYNSTEPLNRIFNASSGTYLNLITCAGSWLPSAKTNDKRLVVYTKLVS